MTDEQRVSGSIDRGEDDRTRLERLAAIFEHSTDAIVGKTLDGTIMDWNAGAERTYGWRAEEAVGRHIGMVFPPERQQELADILERLRRGEETPPYETERLRKDGSIFPALVTISPIRDRTGRVVMGSKTSLDLTDVLRRRRAEQAVRRLQEANEGLAERSRLEGVTLTVREVAHLLNNDLAVVVGSLDLLLEHPELSSEVVTSVHTALAALDTAVQHIVKLQRIVRVETQETPLGLALDVERSV